MSWFGTGECAFEVSLQRKPVPIDRVELSNRTIKRVVEHFDSVDERPASVGCGRRISSVKSRTTAIRLHAMVRRIFSASAKMRELRIVFDRLRCKEDVWRNVVSNGNIDDHMFVPPVSRVNTGVATIVFNRRPMIRRNLDQMLWGYTSSGFIKKLTCRRAC